MNTRDISSLINKSVVTSAEATHHSLADAAVPAMTLLAGGSALGVLAANGLFSSHEDAKKAGRFLAAIGTVFALEGILVDYVMGGSVEEAIKLTTALTGLVMSPFVIAASVYMLARACGMARYSDDDPVSKREKLRM